MALSVVLAFVAGCRQAPTAPDIPPPPVVVATAESRDVTLTREYTGTTVGFETVEIQARVAGFLESVEFEPSTEVREGQLLFVIEPAPYEAARDRAQADVASAEAALKRAESDLERLEQAVKTNAVSQQEVTRARAERDQAQAALLVAEASLKDAEIKHAYTHVRSPITGIIGRNLVDEGNLVGPGSATLMARVVRIDPIFAYFDVDERTVVEALARVGGIDARQRGEADPVRGTIELFLEGLDEPLEGRIDYVDNRVDAGTGTIQVRGVFPNPDGILLPGLFVRVRIPVGERPGALVVPESALSTDLGGRYLLVVGEDDIVARRYVKPGSLRDDGMRVVLDGLDRSERFITRGVLKARPGLPVTPLTAEEYEAALKQQRQQPQQQGA